MENKVFDFIHPSGCDNIGEFNQKDLTHLWDLLDLYLIALRDNLGLSTTTTFGTELEFEQAKVTPILKELRQQNFSNWKLVDDPSLIDCKGAEVVSPILYDTSKNWQDLAQVCSIIRPNGVVGNYCAGHVNIGAHLLGSNVDKWMRFIKMWSIYERVIYRFSYGEYLTPPSNINEYAEPMAIDFMKCHKMLKNRDATLDEIIHYGQNRKHQGVSLAKVKNIDEFSLDNVIEFRCPNATLDPIIWQNNINFFVRLLEYCSSDRYDEDKIEQRRRIINRQGYNFNGQLSYYNEIYIEDAIELCDLIFNNNLDKLNFLRQYTKSFAITNQNDKRNQFVLEQAKKMTRTKTV